MHYRLTIILIMEHETSNQRQGRKPYLALSVEEAEQQLQHDDFFVGEQNLTRGRRVPNAISSRPGRRSHHPLVIQKALSLSAADRGQKKKARNGARGATNQKGGNNSLAIAYQALDLIFAHLRGTQRDMKSLTRVVFDRYPLPAFNHVKSVAMMPS